MTALLDSEASFSQRALQVGLSADVVKILTDQGYTTHGKLAFAIGGSPSTTKDSDVQTWVERLLGREPDGFELACLRRLIFESHTITLSDMQRRVEPSIADNLVPLRKLPPAERVSRQKEQEKRLAGIIFTPESIPSHQLVDTYVEMAESGILNYVRLELCTSRAQEMQSVKKDSRLHFDSDGSLKLGKGSSDIKCDVQTDLAIRNAFSRRHLAMDQAGLGSFSVLESWIHHLFTLTMRQQPSGYAPVSMVQIIECDRQMFIRASNELMSKLERGADGTFPLDAKIKSFMSCPEIMQFVTPLPTKSSSPQVKVAQGTKRPHDGNRDFSRKFQKGKGKGKSSEKSFSLPDGCVSKNAEGKPLCFAFNKGTCKYTGKGPRCARGFHQCYKAGCFRKKPFTECTHSGA